MTSIKGDDRVGQSRRCRELVGRVCAFFLSLCRYPQEFIFLFVLLHVRSVMAIDSKNKMVAGLYIQLPRNFYAFPTVKKAGGYYIRECKLGGLSPRSSSGRWETCTNCRLPVPKKNWCNFRNFAKFIQLYAFLGRLSAGGKPCVLFRDRTVYAVGPSSSPAPQPALFRVTIMYPQPRKY